MPAVETKTAAKPSKPEPREANHKVFRTIHLNNLPVEIEYAYDLDPKDPEGSTARKEAAFEAALAKKYPSGLRKSRSGFYHYELL